MPRPRPALWGLLTLLCASGVLAGGRGPAEISTSVIIVGFHDMEGWVDGAAPCVSIIKKSKGFGAKKINFVTTINAQGSYGKLDRYFYKEHSGNLVPADDYQIGRFKAGLQKCFKAALDAGFTVLHVLPHVDPVDGDGKGMWRNVVKFNPLQKVGPGGAAYSYEDVLLRPTAEALNSVVSRDTVVEFALAGEQGLSLFTFPNEWAQLIDKTKAISSKSKDASRHLMGVSFNWDKVCGCVEPEERDPIKYNNTYLERFERFKKSGGLSRVDAAGLRRLLDKSDFIGASGYASTAQNVVAASHEVSAETVNFELLSFGIDLRDYMFKENKPFVYSEQGLGGCQSNGDVAPDVGWVAKHPFWGLWPRRYETWLDPWQRGAYRDYRRRFYSALAKFAQNGGGPQYRVDGIFLWSVGTWDVHGVHPVSSSDQGSFKDGVIAGYIREANKAANSAAPRPDAAAPPSPKPAQPKASPPAAPTPSPAPGGARPGPRGIASGPTGGATGNVITGPRNPKRLRQ
ncbi:MAG: hypothetical protein J3K34DRAFT_433433 [Monoraphidium minutum]|nr:MAG: hypothetical protein J3K34DRAFT_433433 [Monoraphidium minutum]